MHQALPGLCVFRGWKGTAGSQGAPSPFRRSYTSPHLPPECRGNRRPFSRKVSSLQKSTHFDTGEQRKAFLHFGRRPLLHSHYPQSPTATSREPHRSLMEMKGRSGTSPQQSHTKEGREAKDNHFTTAHNSSQHHKNSYQDTGEISVCSLWMHIRSLRMAIQRLWMHVPRLRTKIEVRCVNNCSTLHKQSQHAANRTAPRYGNRLILLEAFTLSRQTAAELCKNAGESRSQPPSPLLCEAKRKLEHSTRKSFSQQETPSCPEEKSPSNTKENGPAAGEDAASPSVGRSLRYAARGCLLAGDKTCGSGN